MKINGDQRGAQIENPRRKRRGLSRRLGTSAFEQLASDYFVPMSIRRKM